MDCIVFDTNAIRSLPTSDHANWTKVKEIVSKGKWEVIVPTVVLKERERQILAEVDERTRELDKAAQSLRQLTSGPLAAAFSGTGFLAGVPESVRIADIQSSLLKCLSDFLNVTIRKHPSPSVSHDDLVDLCMSQKRPFHNMDNDRGYRDALIWYSVLDLAETEVDAKIHFISANTKDFGAPNEESKLHADLVEMMNARKIETARISFYPSISKFADRYTAEPWKPSNEPQKAQTKQVPDIPDNKSINNFLKKYSKYYDTIIGAVENYLRDLSFPASTDYVRSFTFMDPEPIGFQFRTKEDTRSEVRVDVRIICSVALEGIGYRQPPRMPKRINEVVVETDVVCGSTLGEIVGFSINQIEPSYSFFVRLLPLDDQRELWKLMCLPFNPATSVAESVRTFTTRAELQKCLIDLRITVDLSAHSSSELFDAIGVKESTMDRWSLNTDQF